QEVDIKYKIYNNLGISDVEAVAYAIGMRNASSKTSDELKRDLVLYALQNKAAFVEAVNDMKTTRVKHVIMLSIELGLIKTINQSVQNREGHEIFSCNMGL